MMKNVVLPIMIALLLICQSGMLYGEDLSTHRVYRVTSYNLGAIQGFQDNGTPKSKRELNPLFITNRAAESLDSEHEITVSFGETAPQTSNLNSIAFSAQFDATNKISLHGALGLTRNLWTPDLIGNVNEASWEANLGVIYKLLNNLSYELHFGYMETGDIFTDQSNYSDVESIIMINNKLTLSF